MCGALQRTSLTCPFCPTLLSCVGKESILATPLALHQDSHIPSMPCHCPHLKSLSSLLVSFIYPVILSFFTLFLLTQEWDYSKDIGTRKLKERLGKLILIFLCPGIVLRALPKICMTILRGRHPFSTDGEEGLRIHQLKMVQLGFESRWAAFTQHYFFQSRNNLKLSNFFKFFILHYTASSLRCFCPSFQSYMVRQSGTSVNVPQRNSKTTKGHRGLPVNIPQVQAI